MIRTCSQSSYGGVYRLESSQPSMFNESFNNYSMIYANIGGIVYCKNCYKVFMSKTNLTRVATMRGGALALENDKNC